MDCEVPEIDHLPPGDFRMSACDLRGNVVCGFTDDGQVMSHRVHDVFVVLKRVEIHAGNIALNFCDCFEDILDAESQSLGGIDRIPQDLLSQSGLDAIAQDQIYFGHAENTFQVMLGSGKVE